MKTKFNNQNRISGISIIHIFISLYQQNSKSSLITTLKYLKIFVNHNFPSLLKIIRSYPFYPAAPMCQLTILSPPSYPLHPSQADILHSVLTSGQFFGAHIKLKLNLNFITT